MPNTSHVLIGILILLIGAAAGYFILRADIQRRKLPVNTADMAGCVLAGAIALSALLAGSGDEKAPRQLLMWYGVCVGAVVIGFALSRRVASKRQISQLSVLDAGSSAAAVVYAALQCAFYFIGAIPRQTPVVAAALGLPIAAYLWQRGSRSILRPLAPGVLVGELMALIGVANAIAITLHFYVQSGLNLRNGVLAALLPSLGGVALAILARRSFRATPQVHRILRHANRFGNEPQVEYHRATPECPHPERWHMFDTMTAEIEVLEFLRTLITTIKPELVVETGTFMGVSTLYMAEGLRQNGLGRIITCETDAEVFAAAQAKFDSSGLRDWIDARQVSSLDLELEGLIDVLFSDSLPELREQEVRRFLPLMKPGGIVLIHDASSHLRTVREMALRLERDGLISVVLLPTPRGLVIGQKRSD